MNKSNPNIVKVPMNMGAEEVINIIMEDKDNLPLLFVYVTAIGMGMYVAELTTNDKKNHQKLNKTLNEIVEKIVEFNKEYMVKE